MPLLPLSRNRIFISVTLNARSKVTDANPNNFAPFTTLISTLVISITGPFKEAKIGERAAEVNDLHFFLFTLFIFKKQFYL